MNSAARRILFNKMLWFGFEGLTSVFDFLLWTIHIPPFGMPGRVKAPLKRLVYVGELLPPRTARIAKWVKRSGLYSTLLVCSQRGFVSKFSDPNFEAVCLFRNKWHLRRILRSIPDIVLLHSFAPKSYYPDIARKALDVPFIHDMQDVFTIYYGLNPTLRWLKKELPHERACLEEADGLVAHSLEPNVAYRRYGISRKPPNLFFPLYCDDDFFCNPSPKKENKGIHIVYAGGVAGSHRNPKQYGSIMFHPLIKTLSDQQIHFHIYPSPSNVRQDYEEYEKLALNSEYFHFHSSVAQQDLAKEMSRYDWGILPFFAGQSEQSADKFKYATTLKLFNFLEAGLPVIVSKDIIYQSWLIERYGCGISVEMSELSRLKSRLEVFTREDSAKNVLQVRERLSLKKNTDRLLDFYSKSLRKRKTS
jgi:hypothetical protein